jgi:hypothetical protein
MLHMRFLQAAAASTMLLSLFWHGTEAGVYGKQLERIMGT